MNYNMVKHAVCTEGSHGHMQCKPSWDRLGQEHFFDTTLPEASGNVPALTRAEWEVSPLVGVLRPVNCNSHRGAKNGMASLSDNVWYLSRSVQRQCASH